MATFEKTQSISAFATANKISNLTLMVNKESKKRSILAEKADGSPNEFYRVSDKVTALNADLQISWFTGEDGDPSWMIHPKGEGKLKAVSSMSFTPNLQQAF